MIVMHKHLLYCSACLLLFFNLKGFTQDTTLQSAAPFRFGAAINTTLLRNNATYRALVAKEYNSITPENVMKWGTIHPSANGYNFENGDSLVNFAAQTGKRVHGHTLVWHQSLPNWVNNFAGDSTAWENLLKTHIQTVVAHYKGKLASWDVVNEAFNDDGTLRNTIWLQHLGSNYIARCFQYARQADPDVLLFYNEYGHEYSVAKLNAVAALMGSFKANGIPVDGVGLQMHMNKNTNINSLSNAINVMAATGLKVHISELDIAMNPENNQSLTYTAAIAQAQADKYRAVMFAYLAVPVAQRYGVTTWNVSDADTWITGTYARPDWPLPFDNNYQKKQAYYSILRSFSTGWKYDAATTSSVAGTYTDLAALGSAVTTNYSGGPMSFDDDNSSVQNIGFTFSYNGIAHTQFILNTNGFLKLGSTAPASASIFFPTFNANTNGVISSPETDVLYPYNHDLIGTGSSEYRVLTTGQPGARVCTIQFKNVADKLAPVQYSNMNFQVKLYETSGRIEFVYGGWTGSANAATLITGAVGIKGTSSFNSVNLAKGSGVSWAAPLSAATTFGFINGDYASTGPQFNTRKDALPDAGRTFRFTPVAETALPVTLTAFSARENVSSVELQWTAAEKKNFKHFEIQRSVNGGTFASIAKVAAKGGNINTYLFTDRNPDAANRKLFYRLKLVDADGSAQFSEIVFITLGVTSISFSISALNPITATVDLRINARAKGKMDFVLFNASGKVVKRMEASLTAGQSLLSLSGLSELAPGAYFLQCRMDADSRTLQLLKR
jgi:endo-1,4-beta-xylanase